MTFIVKNDITAYLYRSRIDQLLIHQMLSFDLDQIIVNFDWYESYCTENFQLVIITIMVLQMDFQDQSFVSCNLGSQVSA